MAKIDIDSGEVSATELSSSSIDEFFSNDECSVDELQAFRKNEHLDPELLQPVPTPDFIDVRETWGDEAKR